LACAARGRARATKNKRTMANLLVFILNLR
jgi:hypothetical protein